MPEIDWATILAPALDQVSNGVTVVDATKEGRPLIFVNRAFEKITGYTAAESLGRNCHFLQGRDTDSVSIDRMRQALNAGKRCHVVIRNYRKDGSGFLNELKIYPIPEGAEKPTHFVGIQNDVTAQFVALALQRRIQLPSQMLDKLQTISSPSLNLIVDIDTLQASLESVGVIVATARGKVLHRDPAAQDLLSMGGADQETDSVFELFEGAGLLEAFRPSHNARPGWFSARVRATDPRTAVLLRAHRAELPELGLELMVLLTRSTG